MVSEDRRDFVTDICRFNLLSREEEARLGRLKQQGDATAREALIKSNLRLVVSLAKKFNPNGNFEDFVMAGVEGLIKAVDGYDPNRGCRISTFAYQSIRRWIINALPEFNLIRLPAYQVQLRHNINLLIAEYKQKTGSTPTEKYVRDELVKRWPKEYSQASFTVEKVRDSCAAHQRVQPRSIHGLEDFVQGDGDPACQHRFEQEHAVQTVNQLLSELTQRERQIIALRYGIGCEKPMMLKEIGTMLNISRECVRQIEDRVLEKLRNSAYAQRMKDYALD